jgi:hypothetical protein
MRWIFVLVLSAACGESTQPPPPDLHQGGQIVLPAPCGYTVKTHDGASRPERSTPTLGSDGTPKFLHLNVASDPSSTMAVLWRTNDNTTLATQVQFGTGGKTDQTASGFTFVYDTANRDPVRMHETHLCGLAPDTEYSYRAGGVDSAGKESWSPTYTFRTAPTDPTAEVTYLLIGDTRDGYDTWGASLKAATTGTLPDYILFSGDSVSLGPIQDDWDDWFAAADPVLASVPMILAHGNHESNSTNYFSQFALPGDEQNFSLEIGALHLTVANDSPADPADLTGILAQTLDTNLTSTAPWSVLLSHKALFSASKGPHPQDVVTIRNAWQSIIDQHRVDLVLNGHDHDYERSKPMRGTTAGPDGTVYLVVGSAGAPLYDNGSDFWTAFSEKTNSYAAMRARVGMLSIVAFRGDGSSLDQVVLAK